MVQFYFHIGNGKMVALKDETGAHLDDAANAMAQAAVIASELADDDGQWRGYSVLVVDEEGTEIGGVPIATISSNIARSHHNNRKSAPGDRPSLVLRSPLVSEPLLRSDAATEVMPRAEDQITRSQGAEGSRYRSTGSGLSPPSLPAGAG